jgi:hypothetical protein
MNANRNERTGLSTGVDTGVDTACTRTPAADRPAARRINPPRPLLVQRPSGRDGDSEGRPRMDQHTVSQACATSAGIGLAGRRCRRVPSTCRRTGSKAIANGYGFARRCRETRRQSSRGSPTTSHSAPVRNPSTRCRSRIESVLRVKHVPPRAKLFLPSRIDPGGSDRLREEALLKDLQSSDHETTRGLLLIVPERNGY